jgi:LAO/AO transport system kinase
MIQMGPELDWTPPVVTTTAATGQGVAELWEAVAEHREYLEAGEALARGRLARLVGEVEALASESLRGRIRGLLEDDATLRDEIGSRRVDPYRAAAILAERVRTSSGP